MTARLRVELFELIRRDHREAGLSIRALAERHGVHRRTVRQALASPVPPARKPVVREAPVLGVWHQVIDAWLVEDLSMPKKQRHTARRVWERLVDEHRVEVAESTVRAYVLEARRRLGMNRAKVMVPQTHPLGEEAEVDFGEISFYLNGLLMSAWLFVMRLSASGRGFHHAFANQAQEAFLEGHVLGLDHFGGCPRRIRYDNLKPAVARVLEGRNRDETERFILLRSHYGFDSFFCLPGPEGAHEKGGVEGEVGRFRRRNLVPVPRVGSVAELNQLIAAGDRRDDRRHVDGRFLTVAEHFAVEAQHLRGLPVERFDSALMLSCRVDTKARVCVRQAFYSVPARYAGRRLDVRLGATTVEVLDGRRRVACHARAMTKKVESLVLDHYLEVLVRKPGALPGATALAQARASGAFTATHDRFWSVARRRLGDAAGTRAMIEVLLAHRVLPADALTAGMAAALNVGSVDPAVVMIEARRVAETGPVAAVIPIGTLDRFDRPAPSLDRYDTLLEAAP